ncbi:MAG: tetratricopeptide repeat protein [Candidatus Fermentibacter sp.]|nr:tetratricopeptide repeat protein [Candidatus Fermentibacter sp.]
MLRISFIGLCLPLLACSQAIASDASGETSVAVAPFGYGDSDGRWISDKLLDNLESEIGAASGYTFISGGDFEDAASDLGFSSSDFQYGIPPDIACQAASAAGADLVVYGFVSNAGAGNYTVSWNIGIVGSGSTVTPQPSTVIKNGDAVSTLAGQMVASISQEVGQRAQNSLDMAEYHISTENWPMAITSLKQALSVDPALLDANILLASIYMKAEVDSVDRAGEIYGTILAADPANSEALAGLGQISLRNDLPEQARTYFEQAIEADPDNASAYVGLASAFNAMGMIDEAVNSFESALAQNPQNLQARYALGLLYEQLGDYEAAIPHLEGVLAAHPEFANLRLKLVSAYSETGRHAEAADNAILVLEEQPDNMQLALYTAQLEAAAGRSSSAISRLESIISSSGDRQAYMMLATIYRDGGQYGSMQQVFSRLHSAYPNDPVANYMVGAFYYQSGTRQAQVSELVASNIPVWEEAVQNLGTAVSYLNQVTGYRSGQAQEMVAAAQNAIALCEEKIDRVRRYSE